MNTHQGMADNKLCRGFNKNDEPCKLPAGTGGYCRWHHWQADDPEYKDRVQIRNKQEQPKRDLKVLIITNPTEVKAYCQGITTKNQPCERLVKPRQKYCIDHLKAVPVVKREALVECGHPIKHGYCSIRVPVSIGKCRHHRTNEVKPALTPLRPVLISTSPARAQVKLEVIDD
jgi:hypothetical protein